MLSNSQINYEIANLILEDFGAVNGNEIAFFKEISKWWLGL